MCIRDRVQPRGTSGHRSRSNHDLHLRGVRVQRRLHHQVDGLRTGHRSGDRRLRRPDDPCTGGDVTAFRPGVVAATLARPPAARPRYRGQGPANQRPRGITGGRPHLERSLSLTRRTEPSSLWTDCPPSKPSPWKGNPASGAKPPYPYTDPLPGSSGHDITASREYWRVTMPANSQTD